MDRLAPSNKMQVCLVIALYMNWSCMPDYSTKRMDSTEEWLWWHWSNHTSTNNAAVCVWLQRNFQSFQCCKEADDCKRISADGKQWQV